MEGFQSKMKLPIFGLFSRLNREFHPKFYPYFWNSNYSDYSKTAGMLSGGSFITLGETVCIHGVESLWRRVMNLKDSRGYQIPKIWTILESREFQFGGVSTISRKMKLPIFGKFSGLNREFHPKLHPYFWNSRIQEYFKTAGVSKWEFQTSPSNCLYSGSWVTLEESNQIERFPRLSNSKNQDYFKIAGILIWRGFRVKWNSRFLENFQG